MSDLTISNLARKIKKLRKKLREIDKLELIGRELVEEELLKVGKKSELRAELQELLVSSGDEDSQLVQLVAESSSELSADNTTSDVQTTPEQEKPSHEQQCHSEDLKKSCALATLKQQQQDLNFSKNETYSGDAETVKIITDSRRKQVKSEADEKIQPKKTPPKSQKCPSAGEKWRNSQFLMKSLDGHNGLVTSVAVKDKFLVTGSQDTTIKLWDLTTCEQIRSICGHNDTVTALILLSSAESLAKQLIEATMCDDSDLVQSPKAVTSTSAIGQCKLLAVSCSLDCCIKVWNLDIGHCLRSIYTFNPITCLSFLSESERFCLVCGTAGGKLELWDLMSTDSPITSAIVHQDTITAICVNKNEIFSTSADGTLKIHEFSSEISSLRLTYNSEDVEVKDGKPLDGKRINTVNIVNDTLYIGDEGTNIKAIEIKSGTIRRLKNHTTEFGNTACLLINVDGLLLTSSYHLDYGFGYVNVRSLPDEKYLCSLIDKDTSLIVAMAATFNPDGTVTIVTGGKQLKVWKELCKKDKGSNTEWTRVATITIPQFDQPASDSEDSELESDSDNVWNDSASLQEEAIDEEQKQEWFSSWCRLL